MRVCVTGGTGFIGFRLVEKLIAQGVDVTCYARPSPRVAKLESLHVRCVTGELQDATRLGEAVQGADIVYHVAGATLTRVPTDFFRVNTEGAATVASVCAARSNPPVLVSISSLAAAGPTRPEQPRQESDPPNPVSYYGRSKLKAEERLQEFHDRMPISVVRPPVVFGPGDTAMLSLFQSVRTGLHLVPTWRRQRFSLIHVDDLIEAMQEVAARGARLAGPTDPQRTGTYFATSPEQPTWGELGDLAAASMRDCRRPFKIPIATPVCFLFGWGGECVSWFNGRPSVMNRDKMREATAGSWICSGNRLERELGIRFPARLPEQFCTTVDWYRQQKWL